MTTPDTTRLLAQLRTLLDLTNTEIQIAETRVVQARTDAVRRELSQNAGNGRGWSRAGSGNRPATTTLDAGTSAIARCPFPMTTS